MKNLTKILLALGLTTNCLVLTGTTGPGPPQNVDALSCNPKQATLDIVLVLDTSATVTKPGFTSVTNFLAHTFLPAFTISNASMRVALITADQFVQEWATLTTSTSLTAIANLLTNIQSHFLFTTPYFNAGSAFLSSRNVIFTSPGDRPSAPDVVILFASTTPTDISLATQYAGIFRNTGVYVVVVGTGPSVNMQTITPLATNPSFVFSAPQYTQLSQALLLPLETAFCNIFIPSTTSTTTTARPPVIFTTGPPPPCTPANDVLDVMLLIDASTGLSQPNFAAICQFLAQNFVPQLTIGRRNVMLAVVTYAKNVIPYGPFTLFSDNAAAQSILISIGSGGYMNEQQLNLGKALGAVGNLLSASNGDRPDVPDVVFVFASQNAADPSLAARNSAHLRNNGIFVATVGIGNTNVASYSYGPGFSISVPSASVVTYYSNNLQTVLCLALSGTTTTPATTTTTFPTKTTTTGPAPPCFPKNDVLDILLLIDASRGLTQTGFATICQFLAHVFVPQLTIGLGNVRIAIETYASTVIHYGPFNLYTSTESVQSILLNIATAGYMNQQTLNFGNALGAVLNLLSPNNGDRPSVPDVVLAFASQNPADPLLAVRNSAILRNNGIFLATVAIENANVATYSFGPGFSMAIPSASMISHYGNNFQTVLCLALASRSTTTSTTAAPTTTTPAPCTYKKLVLDIVLLLDTSAYITSTGFNAVADFLSNHFLPAVTIGFYSTRISVVTYSAYAIPYIELNSNGGLTQYQQLMGALKSQYTGNTRTLALGQALQTLSAVLTLNNGDRANVPDVVIAFASSRFYTYVNVYTDGSPTNETFSVTDYLNAQKQAISWRNKGVIILPVGVGPTANMTQLRNLAYQQQYALSAPVLSQIGQAIILHLQNLLCGSTHFLFNSTRLILYLVIFLVPNSH